MKSLDCLKPKGMMVSFGQSSGSVGPIDLGVFGQKGSLFFTRPTLNTYAAAPCRSLRDLGGTRLVSKRRSLAVTLMLSCFSWACADSSAPTSVSDLRAGAAARSAAASKIIAGDYIVVFHDSVSDAPGLAKKLNAEQGGKLHFTYGRALKGFAATLPPAAVAALEHNPNAIVCRA